MAKVNSNNPLKARMVFFRVLKVAFYLLGFLLLFHLVYRDAQSLNGVAFGNAYKLPLYYVAAAWALVAIVQLLCALIFKKNTMAKIIVVAIIGFAVIAGPLAYAEFFIKPEFDKLAEEYDEAGLSFDPYGMHLTQYKDNAEDLNADIEEFLSLYNIKYEYKVYGDENTDMSEYLEIEEGTDVIDTEFFTTDYVFGLSKGGAVYSKNGMYADGYVFGYEQARYILEVYYNTRAKYEALGKDADEELDNAIAALTTNPNSEWNRYKNSAEYKEFYGSDLSDVKNAKRYYITPERLDRILGVLGANISEYANIIKTILNTIASGLLPEGLLDSINANLDLETVIKLAAALDLNIDESTIMNLIEGYSNYQSPQTKPVFYFIQDEELREYAYAKYFGEVHGGKVGSVLIGSRVGEVTLDSNGNEAESLGDRIKMFKRTEKDAAVYTKYYPWFVLRESFLYFSGVIPFSLAAAYMFGALERKTLDKLIKGGNK